MDSSQGALRGKVGDGVAKRSIHRFAHCGRVLRSSNGRQGGFGAENKGKDVTYQGRLICAIRSKEGGEKKKSKES